jgi:hypothetical protein
MQKLKNGIRWFYWIQVAVFGLISLGAAYRGEVSLWIMDEYQKNPGAGNAAALAYFYLLLYSSAVAIPYVLMVMVYKPPMPESRLILLILSGCFAFSCFMFIRPVFEFIRSIPSDVWNGWLVIIWFVVTLLAGILWRSCRRTWLDQKWQDDGSAIIYTVQCKACKNELSLLGGRNIDSFKLRERDLFPSWSRSWAADIPCSCGVKGEYVYFDLRAGVKCDPTR